MHITELEQEVLIEIAESNYRSSDPSEAVWAFGGKPPKMSEQAYGGVLSSLVKKGLIEHWDDDPEATRSGQDSRYVQLTPKAIKLMNLPD